jgi:DNA (cytosine-5)-methyltransferase 1
VPTTTAELFAGIGGFRLAADRIGLRTVWANDLDPRAAAVYRDRFGDDAFVAGDVRDLAGNVPPHDLLTAGFPCQPFSSAGKKRGLRDPRGTLFEVVVDVLRRCEPPAFVLENVKRLLTMERGRHFATILAALGELGYVVEWRLLNAAHFGLPQNRQRVFLLGTRDSPDTAPRLCEPDDVPAEVSSDPRTGSEIVRHRRRFATWGRALGERFVEATPLRFGAAAEPQGLTTILESRVDARFDFTESTRERLAASTPVGRYVEGVEILSNQNGGARMGYTVFGTGGLAPTLTATASRHYERYKVGRRYRRLTNVEYARLQGFPDDHAAAASIYDQYALYGNAVAPPMASWVLGRLGDG